VRTPSRGDAGGVSELRVRDKIQRFDQPEGDRRIIPLAEQILEHLGFVQITLGTRMRVKEAPEELNRIAHMFGRDAERMSFPGTLALVVMPGGMNGDELAKAALAAKPDLKVLFTSGYAEPAVARQGLGAGAWLRKPYTAAELAEKVREILSQ
jgi:CheY-like chemotaxis protein